MTVEIDPVSVLEIINKAKAQSEYLEGIYSLVFPDFDQITSIPVGSVVCNKKTWEHICAKCMAWDKKHDENVVPGGAWMNYGFSGFGGEGLGNFSILVKQHLIQRNELAVA